MKTNIILKDELDLHISETLAVLEYLLKFTDAKHYSSQAKIVAFCRENYGFEPRRDRIGRILDNLYERNELLQEVLNIKLCAVPFKNANKYYISEKGLSFENIADIINSFNFNPLLTKINKEEIKQRLYKAFLSNELKEDLKTDKLISQLDVKKVSFTKREMKNYNILKPLLKKQCLIYFKLEQDWYKENLLHNFILDFTVTGYLYQLYELRRGLYAYVVSSTTGDLLTIPLSKVEDITVINKDEHERGWPTVEEAFKNEKYRCIFDYLNDRHIAISGQDPVEFKFEIRRGDENYYYVRKEFKNYFNVDFNIIKESYDSDMRYNYQTISIKAEPYVIIDFLSDSKILETIDIIGPDEIKDILRNKLNQLIKKLH